MPWWNCIARENGNWHRRMKADLSLGALGYNIESLLLCWGCDGMNHLACFENDLIWSFCALIRFNVPAIGVVLFVVLSIT